MNKKQTTAGATSIYGAITIKRPSRKEVSWDGESLEEGIKKIASLKAVKYRTDWRWPAMGPPDDECDIYVKDKQGKEHMFKGPSAVADLLKLAKAQGIKTTEASVVNLASVSARLESIVAKPTALTKVGARLKRIGK